MNLTIVWGLSVIVDGVTQQGASAFLRNDRPLLILLGLMLFPAIPIASFLVNTLNSHTLGIGMPKPSDCGSLTAGPPRSLQSRMKERFPSCQRISMCPSPLLKARIWQHWSQARG